MTLLNRSHLFLRSCGSLSLGSTIYKARLTTFEAGDFCILRHMKSSRKYFIGPLEQEGMRNLKGGSIAHSQLLGAPVRSIVKTNNDSTGYMAHFPTLEEYILNVPRACTPIYPKDASTIVQLLDAAPGHRILEAGTGNGSLTLHLARAVAGGGHVDTVDLRESHSKTAQKHIERFERGKYQSLVSFWVGKLSDVLSTSPHMIQQPPSSSMLEAESSSSSTEANTTSTTLSPPEELYDGVALDMPTPSEELSTVLPFLRNDRFIVCYLPNMTQVLDLMQTIRTLPLFMEDCLEVEWKEWDIRPTIIRSAATTTTRSTTDPADTTTIDSTDNMCNNDDNHSTTTPKAASTTTTTTKQAPVGTNAWVCRPKNFDVKGHTAFLVKLRKCSPASTTS
ncbi:S-adenosyl-L-methionine-dependent methyltransferase [Absidia repens]|uniref:tRNA (adenine(58)-N(1))-methyltransferase catalytic subunit TRM61 n=1 Tax=Absidia repens TaxID=90262 RepID=A0A1X2IMI7_9FUNG|nr:S-adenosyl-L-methionine-dependent methyltransferase [Absidia repens]